MRKHEKWMKWIIKRKREIEGVDVNGPLTRREKMWLVMRRYTADYIAAELGVSKVLVYKWVSGERAVSGEYSEWWDREMKLL